MAGVTENYSFTVDELLSAAGTQRRSMECGDNYDTDHVVELQLVVAALNTLRVRTYYRKGWERDLVDFFNEKKNLKCKKPEKNREKGRAVKKYIRYRNGKRLTKKEQKWINKIKAHWKDIRGDMDRFDFKRFQRALNNLLEMKKK